MASLNNLATLYEEEGKHDVAAEYRRRAASVEDKSVVKQLQAPRERRDIRVETAPSGNAQPTPSAEPRAKTYPEVAPEVAAPKATAPTTLPEARPLAGDEKSDWDVVPVFYGTDRDHETNPKRLAYNTDRAHRLELGRALVTVPKIHQVPQIERPWAIRIPYFDVTIYEEAEDPKKHFTLQEIKSLSKADFLRLVRARLAASNSFKNHALVFVHGYDIAFDNALYRTAQIAYDLHFDGAPFLYSWPSRRRLEGEEIKVFWFQSKKAQTNQRPKIKELKNQRNQTFPARTPGNSSPSDGPAPGARAVGASL